jgi:superfamily I DNA/RNA helicase
MKEIDNIAYHHGIFEEYDEYSVVYSLLEIAYNLEDSTIDFTDMIVLPCMHNGIKKCIRKYDVIFVDECQDLSQEKQVLLKNSIKYKGRFIAVGDENQSITGYAGSDCDSFSKMKELAKGKEFPLSVCYRCGKKIINLAKEIVPAIEPYEENKDGEIKVVKDLTDVKPGDVILSRKSAPTISLCLKFIANGIPAKVKGRDMLEGLKKLVEKSKATNFEGLYQYLDKEYKKVIKKITNRGDKEPENAIQAITFRDKIECIKSIAESCNEFSDMGNKLDTLFSDYTDGRFVMLSTIHKAKGLEWDRVFIILPKDIPLKWKSQQEWEYQQEINLKYVAITRAKKELFFVNLDLDQLLTCQLP